MTVEENREIDPMWKGEYLIGILEIRWRKDGKMKMWRPDDVAVARKMLEEGIRILERVSKEGQCAIIKPGDPRWTS